MPVQSTDVKHPRRSRAARTRFDPLALLRFREGLGLDQQTFAARIGYSRALVSMVERGQARPSVKYLEAVAERCGLDLGSVWR